VEILHGESDHHKNVNNLIGDNEDDPFSDPDIDDIINGR